MSDPHPLSDFLSLLLQEGRALTRGDLHRNLAGPADLLQAEQVLANAAKLVALDSPAQAPDFDGFAAVWAGQIFAWSCGMLIDRSETDVALPNRLSNLTPDLSTASAHWSADLVLRYCKDLIDRSAKIGKEDPLHDQLLKVLEPWPLSAVGTESQNPEGSDSVILANECLRTMYIDRIIQLGDQRRASRVALQPWIRKVIGGHNALAGKLLLPTDEQKEEAE